MFGFFNYGLTKTCLRSKQLDYNQNTHEIPLEMFLNPESFQMYRGLRKAWMWIPFFHSHPEGSERRAPFVLQHFSNVWTWWGKTRLILQNPLDSGIQTKEHTRRTTLGNVSIRLDLKWWSDWRIPTSPTPASYHTCTAISRLINCESCSLETLNHSFSVLSRAASLAALTRGSALFTQHCRRRRQRWWAW